MAGYGDDGGVFVQLRFANFFARFETVHAGHTDIEEDDIIGVFSGGGDGGLAVLHVVRLGKGQLNGAGDGASRNRIVIDDHDAYGGRGEIGARLVAAHFVEQVE